MTSSEKLRVIDTYVNVLNYSSLVDEIVIFINERKARYICLANVHMCMEGYNDKSYQKIVNDADLVLADGRPLLWLQRIHGYKHAKQIRGVDLTNVICSLSIEEGFKIGFYGGASDKVLDSVVDKLNISFPNINIRYLYSPPFRENTTEEDSLIVSEIQNSGVDILFVGLGCPKQEVWMAKHKDSVNCVMIGVGAAFDFIAQNKRMAPNVMRVLGLEWVFRLIMEPKRLWKRYLILNPLFVWHIALRGLRVGNFQFTRYKKRDN